MAGNPVKVRQAIRAILLTPMAEVLLMRIRPPGRDDCFWIAPGGGMESGETVESCLKRELEEELGLIQFDVGPLVWLRQHTFNWDGQRIRQSEQYHVVHIARFAPKMSDAMSEQDSARASRRPFQDGRRLTRPLIALRKLG
ncbi:MAG: NUDIX domain-containing protein [Deltaproteobacteria bacterium]